MGNVDQRRAPRIAAACHAEIDDRFGAWSAITEDVSVRGCRIATRRAPKLGALVQITLRADRLRSPLRMAGQAVWARDGRIGILFVGPLEGAVSPAAWIRDLAAALGDAAAPPPPPSAVRPAPAPAGTAAAPQPSALHLGGGTDRPREAPPRARAGGSGR